MRIVFAGTPAFAERALLRLLEAGHEIPLVVTQPDRSAGRGMHAAQSAVKRLAIARGLVVYQPASLRDMASAERIGALRPDALVVAAYGLILPAVLLAIAPHGALNIHASLLPRWRGAAPIQRALLAGDRETGVSIMRMDEGLDTGPVLARRALAISDDDTAATLHDKLAALGSAMIVAALSELAAGRAVFTPQALDGVTFAQKIAKREALIDWTGSDVAIARAVRAFNPAPGTSTTLDGVSVKVWRARTEPGSGPPGVVLRSDADGVLVACGSGALRLIELQRAGGRRIPAAEFLRGSPIAPGTRLGAA